MPTQSQQTQPRSGERSYAILNGVVPPAPDPTQYRAVPRGFLIEPAVQKPAPKKPDQFGKTGLTPIGLSVYCHISIKPKTKLNFSACIADAENMSCIQVTGFPFRRNCLSCVDQYETVGRNARQAGRKSSRVLIFGLPQSYWDCRVLLRLEATAT